MSEKYKVTLTQPEREELLALISKGKAKATTVARAHILLLADEDKSDQQIADNLHLSPATVARIRKRFVEGNLLLALYDRPRTGRPPKLTASVEATLIALACSQADGERSHWTMQMLADKLIELKLVDHISAEAVRKRLKKTY